jgi:hypothetical protein
VTESSIAQVLRSRLAEICVIPPVRSPGHAIAAEFLRMADAYARDGVYFFQIGDRVNSLASVSYAWGWLDEGVYLGLLGEVRTRTWHPGGLARDQHAALEEKAGRYLRILNAAIGSVTPASEQETIPYETACAVMRIPSEYAQVGAVLMARESPELSLVASSYGHAWIDAAIRSGLLRTIRNRELFTI